MKNIDSKFFRIAGGNLIRAKDCDKTGRSAFIESLPCGYEVRMSFPPITINRFTKKVSTLKEAKAMVTEFIKTGKQPIERTEG